MNTKCGVIIVVIEDHDLKGNRLTFQIDQAVNAQLSAIRGVLEANPIDARITLSGYEGSELIVARLLIESVS